MISIVASVRVFWNFKQWPKTSWNANVRNLLIGFWFAIWNKDVLDSKLDIRSLKIRVIENQISDFAFYSGDKTVPKNKVFKKIIKNVTNFETFPRKKWLLLLQIKRAVFIINDLQSLIVDWAFLWKRNVSLNLAFSINSQLWTKFSEKIIWCVFWTVFE